jgi:hypothetical protein
MGEVVWDIHDQFSKGRESYQADNDFRKLPQMEIRMKMRWEQLMEKFLNWTQGSCSMRQDTTNLRGWSNGHWTGVRLDRSMVKLVLGTSRRVLARLSFKLHIFTSSSPSHSCRTGTLHGRLARLSSRRPRHQRSIDGQGIVFTRLSSQ